MPLRDFRGLNEVSRKLKFVARKAGLYFLFLIGLLGKRYFYLLLSFIIKLLMTGRNQDITPHVRNYRSPLRSRSNNSIELNMILCVIASTIPRISMNPNIAIAQDTCLASRAYFLVQDPLTNWNKRISSTQNGND
ncbi:hypothetical protein M9H77_31115 [Catharanthus roseus]|uniref:Uncharacterized protein n=1 Tax=Catharanthus roseus TaxID=4058 RepID=A0ACC0A1H8_CATRO|nr:hypothetical protein M9H77_31115 [Catharanthus roseus]